MGILSSSSDSSDSTAGVSQYLTEGLSSTGYHKFSGGNTLNISSGIMDVGGDVLANAVDNYNNSYWKEDIKQKLLEEQKKNPKLLDDIKLIYGKDLDTFAATLGDEEAFKEQFLLPHYKPNLILKELGSLLSDLKEIKDQGDSITENQFRNSINRINERKNTLNQSKLELILTEC